MIRNERNFSPWAGILPASIAASNRRTLSEGLTITGPPLKVRYAKFNCFRTLKNQCIDNRPKTILPLPPRSQSCRGPNLTALSTYISSKKGEPGSIRSQSQRSPSAQQRGKSSYSGPSALYSGTARRKAVWTLYMTRNIRWHPPTDRIDEDIRYGILRLRLCDSATLWLYENKRPPGENW